MHKFDPRKFLAVGLLVGAATLFQFSRLNLDAGYWDFFWPQFIQGISLAMLFVPLTTITMSNIPREGMGNATSLFNLMRNLGGSIGIAGVSTLVARYSQKHINMLGANVTPYNPKAQRPDVAPRSRDEGARFRNRDGGTPELCRAVRNDRKAGHNAFLYRRLSVAGADFCADDAAGDAYEEAVAWHEACRGALRRL